MITVHCPTCNRTVYAKTRPNSAIDGRVTCPACGDLIDASRELLGGPGAARGYQAAVYGGPTSVSGMAVIGLIAAVLGLSFCPCVGTLVGLVCSWLGLQEIAESEKNVGDGRLTGRGLAVAGIVISLVSVLVVAAFLLLYLLLK